MADGVDSYTLLDLPHVELILYIVYVSRSLLNRLVDSGRTKDLKVLCCNPTIRKSFMVRKFCLLRVPRSSTQSIQMKSVISILH